MDKRKILIIGSIILIAISIVISVFMIFNKPEEEEFTIDGINLPTNKEILKDATVGNLKITNVSLLTRDGVSTYKAKVVNETEEDISIKILSVVFYKNEVEHDVDVLRDVVVLANSDTYISIDSEEDFTDVTKIEYVLE